MRIDWNVIAIVAVGLLVTLIDWILGTGLGTKLFGFAPSKLDQHLDTTVKKLAVVAFLGFLQMSGQSIQGSFLTMQLSALLGVGAGVTFSAYGLAFIVSTLTDILDKFKTLGGTQAAPALAAQQAGLNQLPLPPSTQPATPPPNVPAPSNLPAGV